MSIAAARYETRLRHAYQELEQAGLNRNPLSRYVLQTQRHLGLRPRPVVYRSWFDNGLRFSLAFMLCYIALTSLTAASSSLTIRWTQAIVGGLVFGVFMAINQRRLHRRHRLSQWQDLG